MWQVGGALHVHRIVTSPPLLAACPHNLVCILGWVALAEREGTGDPDDKKIKSQTLLLVSGLVRHALLSLGLPVSDFGFSRQACCCNCFLAWLLNHRFWFSRHWCFCFYCRAIVPQIGFRVTFLAMSSCRRVLFSLNDVFALRFSPLSRVANFGVRVSDVFDCPFSLGLRGHRSLFKRGILTRHFSGAVADVLRIVFLVCPCSWRRVPLNRRP